MDPIPPSSLLTMRRWLLAVWFPHSFVTILILLVLCVGLGLLARRFYGKAAIPIWVLVAIGVAVPILGVVGGVIYGNGLAILLTVGPTLAVLYLFARRARRTTAAPSPHPAPGPGVSAPAPATPHAAGAAPVVEALTAPPARPPASPAAQAASTPPATATTQTAGHRDRFCSRCGAKLEGDERFCGNCGASRAVS